MNDKNFNIAATVTIVLVAFLIGYFAYKESLQSNETIQPPARMLATTTDTTSAATSTVTYTNNDYGFTFTLPTSWTHYTLVTSKWIGNAANSDTGTPYAIGPLISIRHPLWTDTTPRQDIPIMIFTLKQWGDLQQELFHVGAAPIPPRELGRNANYVFALPARYNYAFPAGYEEVDRIITAGSLHAY
jgi:hypothetical protein